MRYIQESLAGVVAVIASPCVAAQVECASLSAGGAASSDMTMILGQPIVGIAANADHGVQAGFLGCIGIDPPSIPGDLDGDGFVNGVDLGQLLLAWGACQPPCPADLNDDGFIDGADLGLLLLNWG